MKATARRTITVDSLTLTGRLQPPAPNVIDRIREEIEQRYAKHQLGSGAIGGTFGEILCHELHMGDDERSAGLHFGALAKKWGVSLPLLGTLIADHCNKLPGWESEETP